MRKNLAHILRSRAARALVIAAVLSTAAVACGNKNRRADSLISDKDPVRGFLATIPADTPYAFVAAEPVPLGPMMEWMDGWYSSLEQMMPDPDQMLADEYIAPESKLIYAVLSEFKGKYNAEGMKELGFSLSPRFAIYGIGVLPSLRMDLDDPEAFMAMIGRVEQKSGYVSTKETLEEREFWSYELGSQGRLVMSVQNRQLVWGLAENDVAQIYVPYLLGTKPLPKSMADDDKITPIAERHGFQRYGVGFVDFGRIFSLIYEPGESIHDQIQAGLMDEPQQAPPGCVAETKRLIGAAPRAVFGYEELSAARMRAAGGLELNNDLGARLAAAKQPMPLLNTDAAKKAPVAAAFGFDVGAVIDIVSAEATAVQQAPFQCVWYRELNSVADEVNSIVARIPPLVTNLRGAGAVLSGVSKQAPAPTPPPAQPAQQGATGQVPPPLPPAPMMPTTRLEGLAVVNTANPGALLSFLRTFAQEFENVTPDPQGIPFKLPQHPMLDMFVEPHVILTANSLALSSGNAMTDDAQRLVTAPAEQGGFLTLTYNMKRIGELISENSPNTGAQFTNGNLMMSMFGPTAFSIDPRESGIFFGMDVEMPKK